jgi:hypothetical protein
VGAFPSANSKFSGHLGFDFAEDAVITSRDNPMTNLSLNSV